MERVPQSPLATATVLLLLLGVLHGASAASVKGRALLSADPFNAVRLRPGSVVEVRLIGRDGQEQRTFCTKEGHFTVQDVAPGTYLLLTLTPDLIYPDVRIEVKPKGVVRAEYAVHGVQLPISPLVLRPIGAAQYFEVRKPVDVMGFIKSPYGLMIGFMVFVIWVMPKLKVDPEEFREAMSTVTPASSGANQQPQRSIRDR